MCFGNAVQILILNCNRGQPEPHWFPYNLPKEINTQHNQQTVKQVHLAYVYIENNASALEWKNTFSVNAPETVYSDVSSAISHISSIFKYDKSRHCIRNHWFSHEDLDELIQLCLIRTEASAAGQWPSHWRFGHPFTKPFHRRKPCNFGITQKKERKKTSSFVLSRMLTESVLAPPRAPVDAFPNYCQITIRCFHKPVCFCLSETLCISDHH